MTIKSIPSITRDPLTIAVKGSRYYYYDQLSTGSQLALNYGRNSARVQDGHADHLIEDPAAQEASDLMVLLDVQRVQDREDTEEVRLRQQVHGLLRHLDRALE